MKSPARTARPSQPGIPMVEEPLLEVCCESGAIVGLTVRSGKTYRFDTLYSALGCNVRSELARALGADCDDVGQIKVDDFRPCASARASR